MLPSCTACGQSFIVLNQIDRHVCSAMPTNLAQKKSSSDDQIASFEYRLSTPLDIPSPLGNIDPRTHPIFSQFATISTLLALGRYSSTS
ncbi:hypothetical protein CC2G_014429 [Coprinopsis cinerea AmutBmut pab1-1]|nr:hypothetical protein CC2G_014429 [Coprinopsis cinerea AmutBmut pab1-1]